jgi:hypothetical protein
LIQEWQQHRNVGALSEYKNAVESAAAVGSIVASAAIPDLLQV